MNDRATPEPDHVLTHLRPALQARLGGHLRQLILFGSRARGDHTPDADYDLLAILDEKPSDLDDRLYELGGELLCQQGAVVSVIPVTQEEYERRIYSPLFMNVRKEGIAL
jgi:predicted nucleotidyltransferase